MGSHSPPQARFVRRSDKLQKAPDWGCKKSLYFFTAPAKSRTGNRDFTQASLPRALRFLLQKQYKTQNNRAKTARSRAEQTPASRPLDGDGKTRETSFFTSPYGFSSYRLSLRRNNVPLTFLKRESFIDFE